MFLLQELTSSERRRLSNENKHSEKLQSDTPSFGLNTSESKESEKPEGAQEADQKMHSSVIENSFVFPEQSFAKFVKKSGNLSFSTDPLANEEKNKQQLETV